MDQGFLPMFPSSSLVNVYGIKVDLLILPDGLKYLEG
jgi:hypothetical protein